MPAGGRLILAAAPVDSSSDRRCSPASLIGKRRTSWWKETRSSAAVRPSPLSASTAPSRFNTIYDPQRWALRILQETQAPEFVPSRRGWFSDNLVAFRSSHWAEGGVNVGPGTAPQTFRFARNWWYCLDEPARSRPRLPVEETGGVYGRAPLFRDAPAGDLRLEPGSPARIAGAETLADSLPQSPE